MTKKELLSDELLTIAEVMAYLKRSRSTVDNLIKAGKIKACGIGGSVYVKASDIQKSLIPIN